MRVFLEILALFISLVLQFTLTPKIAIAGVSPDIVFAAVVSLSAFSSFLTGVGYGAAAGLLLDMLFLKPGYFTLQYALSGAVSGLVSMKKAARFLQPLIICAPAYFLKEIVTLIMLSFQGAAFEWLPVTAKAGIGAIYTAAVSFIVYVAAEVIYRVTGARRNKGIIFAQKP